MSDPVTLGIGGAVLGGLLDNKNPMRGAALGGLGGYFLGPMAAEGLGIGGAATEMGLGSGISAAAAPVMEGMGLGSGILGGGSIMPELAFASPAMAVPAEMGLGTGLKFAQGALSTPALNTAATGTAAQLAAKGGMDWKKIGEAGMKFMGNNQQQQRPQQQQPQPAPVSIQKRAMGDQGGASFSQLAPGMNQAEMPYLYGMPVQRQFGRG